MALTISNPGCQLHGRPRPRIRRNGREVVGIVCLGGPLRGKFAIHKAGLTDFSALQVAMKCDRTDRLVYFAFDLYFFRDRDLARPAVDGPQGQISRTPRGKRRDSVKLYRQADRQRTEAPFVIFGSPIHGYTIDEAGEGSRRGTVYETRFADVHIAGESIDQIFERIFRDRKPRSAGGPSTAAPLKRLATRPKHHRAVIDDQSKRNVVHSPFFVARDMLNTGFDERLSD